MPAAPQGVKLVQRLWGGAGCCGKIREGGKGPKGWKEAGVGWQG